ncbi:MAG: sulfatase-like hydrolase/transferase [bacterium]
MNFFPTEDRPLAEFLLLVTVFSTGVLYASTVGGPLVLSPLYLPFCLLLLGLMVLLFDFTIRFVTETTGNRSRLILPGLFWLVVVGRWVLPGHSPPLIVILYSGLMVTTAFVFAEPNRDKDLMRGWIPVLSIFVLSPQTEIVGLMETTEGKVLVQFIFGLTGSVILGYVMSLFLQVWVRCSDFIDRHRKATGGVALTIFVVAGGLWTVSWKTPLLEAGRYDFQTRFKGSIPSFDRAGSDQCDRLPGIILISVDTLRWDMVPPRAETVKAPTLKQLKTESIRFTRTFASSGWTLPSHASLFTGLSPVEHGAVLPENYIYKEVPLFSQVLKKLGYRTAAFTEAGYVSRVYGFQRGFDTYWEQVVPFAPNFFEDNLPGALTSVARIKQRILGNQLEINRRRSPDLRYFSRTLEAAKKWFLHNPEEPRFVFLHTYQVHDFKKPYPRSYRRLKNNFPDLAAALKGSTDTSRVEKRRLRRSVWKDFIEGERRKASSSLRLETLPSEVRSWLRARLGIYTRGELEHLKNVLRNLKQDRWRSILERSVDEQINYFRTLLDKELNDNLQSRHQRALQKLYEYEVERVDRRLGQFFDWLKAQGEYEDKLIVFVSDHGEGLRNREGFNGHTGRLHEVLTRVPLWIRLPGESPPSRSISDLVQLKDVFPMVFRHLGLKASGGSAIPQVERTWKRTGQFPIPDRSSVHSSVAWKIRKDRILSQPNESLLAVRGNNFKVESGSRSESVRYVSMNNDSLGQNSLVPSDVPGEKRRQLRDLLSQYRKLYEQFPNPFGRSESASDQKIQSKLEGLGYF